MVGPSKFIGYAGMTAERYHEGWGINGGTTEGHFAKKGWFRELTPSDPRYGVAERLADQLCPSGHHQRKAKFRILKDEYDKEVRRLNEKGTGRRGDSNADATETEKHTASGRRSYWVISPTVDGKPQNVEAWKKEIVRRHSAIIGWPPDYENHSMGRKFVGRGDPSVQPGDVILIARGKLRVDMVGFGIVRGPARTERISSLFAQDVQLRHLAPFRQCIRAPGSVPLLDVLQHSMALVQLHPHRVDPKHDPNDEKVCKWIDRQLRLEDEENHKSKPASLPGKQHLKVTKTDGLPKSKHRGYTYKTERALKTAEKKEERLLARYERWLDKKGRKLGTLTFGRMKCDCWEEQKDNLIEAKASTSREDVRMAVGELLDYAFQGSGVCARPNKAVLLPSRPSDERISWLEPLGIKVVWREKGAFVDNANGQFV